MATTRVCILITTFLMVGCVETLEGPINRSQTVYHYICPEESFHLWFPVNSLGIAYTKDEYKVDSVPQGCRRKELGVVDNIGDLPK